MDSYTNVYLDTIDPLSPYSRLIATDVLFSIILHVCLYLVVIKLFSNIFNLKITKKIYINIIFVLHIVMILGYIGRLARSKSIYNNLLKRGENKEQAKDNTIKIMHNAYFTYYFLG
tara:strand:+ start:596 stop:943 length:348 start_codon:yes stop_codon:yes gene_type:complete